MDTGQIIALIFLIIIGLSFLGATLSREGLRNLAIWGVILGGAYWVSTLADTGPGQVTFAQTGTIEVPKARDGHFHLALMVNGVEVDFLVDTGATQVVLTQDDARRIGLDPDDLPYIDRAFTANGEVAIAPVRLDTVELGGIRDTNLRASVNSGDMDGSLLGMTYLSRFESVEIWQDRLILRR